MKNESNLVETLKKRIAELEHENLMLRSVASGQDMCVKVPGKFFSEFEEANDIVGDYFKKLKVDASKGSIEIDGERYVLVRASALSYDFFHSVITLYSNRSPKEAFEEGRNFLFDMGYVIGKEDAKRFHEKLELKDPIKKLSAGPLHFAYTGWAFVEILAESNPVLSDDFVLRYNHPYSFEADAWLKKGVVAQQPVCVMNAAYSSAWCEESFGMKLTAVEVTCRAKGDSECSFVMAPPHKIHEYIENIELSKEDASVLNRPFFFERSVFEQRLRTNEQMLNDAQEMAQLGSWYFNLETNELKWTDQLYAIFEFPNEPNPNLYQDYLSRFAPDELPILNKCVQEAIELGKSYKMRHSILLDNGRVKWLQCSGVPELNESGKVFALKGIVQDVTDKVLKEVELDSFFELSIDLMSISNEDGFFLRLSPSWSKLLGYSLEELYAKPFIEFVHPDDLEKTYGEINDLNDGGLTLSFENRYVCKDGTVVFLSWNAIINLTNGLIYATTRNITKQKESEKLLKSEITEKETLLQEIHHRVKNNLQIIVSLLSLQSKMNDDNDALNRLYEDSINRIKSMASLHELFYQSLNTERIDFNEYCNKLLTDLLLSFKGVEHKVVTKLQVDDIFLNLDTAVPLGLMINEIITNAFKHGVKDQEKGRIYITIEKKDDGYVMHIGDNGPGFFNGSGFELGETMGMLLLQNLADQIDGELTLLTKEKGVHYKFEFKEVMKG